MKIYYKIPDTDNKQLAFFYQIFYENIKLRILLAVRDIRKITDKENGMIVIERTYHPDTIEFHLRGFSPEATLMLRAALTTIRSNDKTFLRVP